MDTQVVKVDSPGSLRRAAALLREGRLVAFPTETVYGLGASILFEDAVRSIFEAKGRPADNPLIVHIWHPDQLEPLCEIPKGVPQLMDAFWPGPLTLLFPRTERVPDVVTAGLPTVAVRMPSMPCTYELLKACDQPIAAPSANRSGRPSPTTAAHVLEDMDGRIPLILDGGPCQVGLESTVLDLTHGEPTILRPGGITREMIQDVLHQNVALAGSILRPLRKDETALSPGMRYRHYAPTGTVTLVEGEEAAVLQAMAESVAQRLRKHRLLATTVVLFVRDSGLYSFERQAPLERPTSLAITLRSSALRLLRAEWDWRRSIRSLGVRATGLMPEKDHIQLSFFEDDVSLQKRERAERTVDKLRQKYDKNVILLGASAYAGELGRLPNNAQTALQFPVS